MTLPSNTGTGTVTGLFVDSSGVPIEGTVTFTPAPDKMLDASAVPPATILPSPVTVTLANGTFTQALVATTDPDLNPSGWTYKVDFALKSGITKVPVTPYSIKIPEGATVDLTSASPVPSAAGTYYTVGAGVAVGGTTGEVLTKASGVDYDTAWTAPTGVQPGDLAPVATSGAYADLTGQPAIPNSPDDIGAATAAQGAAADQALAATATIKGELVLGSPSATTNVKLLTAAAGGQGLASDGTYFYWGTSNGNGVPGSIIKIDATTGATLATLSGPEHCAGGDYSPVRGTMFWTSYNPSATNINTWEVALDGTKLRGWDFSSLGGDGGLVAVDDTVAAGNIIYQLTGTTSLYDIHRIQVNDDGTWVDLGAEVSGLTLGIPQGMTCRNGVLYLLVDEPISYPMHSVHEFTQVNGVLVQGSKWSYFSSPEAEGMCFYGDMLVVGDGALNIWQNRWQPYHDLLLAQSLSLIGANGLAGGASAEVMLLLRRLGNVHTCLQVDATAGYDPFIYMSQNGSGFWTVRADYAAGEFKITHEPSGSDYFRIGANGTVALHNTLIAQGAGSPEGVTSANPGSLYLNQSGGAGTTLYVKESGTGNTGWIAK